MRKKNFINFNGKPSEGTVALILDKQSNKIITKFRTILIEKKPLNSAKMFRFMIKKTHDPEDRFLKAVKLFSYEYFENPKIFNGAFTATFPYKSNLVSSILKKKKCNVQFFENNTGFHFGVEINKLKKNSSEWIYTYYHNLFFNPELNENIDILYFNPNKKEFKKID